MMHRPPAHANRPKPLRAAAACAVCGLAVALGSQPSALAQAGERVLIIENDLAVSVVDTTGQRYWDLAREALEQGRRDGSEVLALIVLGPGADAAGGVGAVSDTDRRARAAAARMAERLEADALGAVELADGQRLPGTLLPSGAEAESIAWSHPAFGRLQIPFERIARIALPDEAGGLSRAQAAPADVDEDVLLLANGDRLRGFLLSFGSTVQFETNGGVVSLPIERVAGALLAQEPAPLVGRVAWLDDGTVVAVSRVEIDPAGGVVLELPSGERAVYDARALRGVAMTAERLVPLSSLTPVSQQPVGDRLFVDPVSLSKNPDDVLLQPHAVLGAYDVELPGPMSVVYDLPFGSWRLAGTAALTPEAGGWGDAELVLLVDGEERWRRELTQKSAAHPFTIDAQGTRLEIRLEPGRFGPIRDRVILHRPLVVLAP